MTPGSEDPPGPAMRRIVLVTDFGPGGPYVGQLKLRLAGLAPGVAVIDLVSDLVPFRPDLAAYLLPALAAGMPRNTVYLCVVDPGVGSERAALAIEAAGDWYLGPDNGLLAPLANRMDGCKVLRIDWRPEELSDSFHGRDLFAPIAAMLCDGKIPASRVMDPAELVGADWGDELPRLLYADRYGNLMTGLRAASLDRSRILRAGDHAIAYARTFCEVPAGQAFWYGNALGLVELAVNRGRADSVLGLVPGDAISTGA